MDMIATTFDIACSYRPLVICSRRALSFAATSVGKSSDSYSGRISRSEGPDIGLGQRLAHSTASSMERTCQIQNPATSSLVSAKGPSVTVRLVPLKWIRLANLVGLSPSAASMIPALTSSSLYFPICSNISSLHSAGEDSFSDSVVAFTRTITRIKPPGIYRPSLTHNLANLNARSRPYHSRTFPGDLDRIL